MATPRKVLVDSVNSGVYHCISNCVRGAILSGPKKDRRRQEILDRLRLLVNVFAIDGLGFSILSSHFHLLLRTHPERAEEWSAEEVVRRWSMIHPSSVIAWAMPIALSRIGARSQSDCENNTDLELQEAIHLVAQDANRVIDLRRQLSSLSKFHQVLKQGIAYTANKEDGTRGHFWEARFRSIRVLDAEGLIAVMSYVDLNPIHAGIATKPEEAEFVSIRDRIDVHRWAGIAGVTPPRPYDADRRLLRGEAGSPSRSTSSDGDREVWLAPIDARKYDDGILPMTLRDYLRFVDFVGRLSRSDKFGKIPIGLAPIAKRLESDPVRVASIVSKLRRSTPGTAIGCDEALKQEALRRGRSRVRGIRPDLN